MFSALACSQTCSPQSPSQPCHKRSKNDTSIASFVPRITRVLKLQTQKCRPLSSPCRSLPTFSETRIVPQGVTSRNVFSIGQIPSFLSRLRSIYYLWLHQVSIVNRVNPSIQIFIFGLKLMYSTKALFLRYNTCFSYHIAYTYYFN